MTIYDIYFRVTCELVTLSQWRGLQWQSDDAIYEYYRTYFRLFNKAKKNVFQADLWHFLNDKWQACFPAWLKSKLSTSSSGRASTSNRQSSQRAARVWERTGLGTLNWTKTMSFLIITGETKHISETLTDTQNIDLFPQTPLVHTRMGRQCKKIRAWGPGQVSQHLWLLHRCQVLPPDPAC